jgi:hypothetical protein
MLGVVSRTEASSHNSTFGDGPLFLGTWVNKGKGKRWGPTSGVWPSSFALFSNVLDENFSEGRIALGVSGMMIRLESVREPAFREVGGRRPL